METREFAQTFSTYCQIRERGFVEKAFSLYLFLLLHSMYTQYRSAQFSLILSLPCDSDRQCHWWSWAGQRARRDVWDAHRASQQKSVAFSEMVAEAQKRGSRGPKKINFIFLSFLAWPELSVFLKQQAGQEEWDQLPGPWSKLFIRSWIYCSPD